MMTEIAAGDYAVATARVENYDFATPWYQFFNSLLQDNKYQMRFPSSSPLRCFPG
jgi:DNA gyrase inhibitor